MKRSDRPNAPTTSPGSFIRVWLCMVAVLSIAVLPLCDLLCLTWPKDPQVSWLRGLTPRKLELARRTPGTPRLVIVSGSSGLFSLDAELLQRRLEMPVVNLGTHAGLGLRYLLQDARSVARRGDIMLLYLEDAHYRRADAALADLEQKAIWTNTPARLAELPWSYLLQELYGHPLEDYAQGWLRRNEAMSAPEPPEQAGAPTYSSRELSPAGDFRGRAAVLEREIPAARIVSIKSLRRESARELNEFDVWCKARGVKMVAALPGIMRPPSDRLKPQDRNTKALGDFYAHLQVPFLHIKDLDLLPQALMLDTPYHASTAGRRIITEAFARELGALLGHPSPAGDGLMLLVKSPHAVLDRELVLAREGVSDCRYLAESALQSPLCIQPTELASAHAAGGRIVFADPEIAPLLQQTGLSSKVVEEKRSTLADWIRGYPRHLFALVAIGKPDTTTYASELPEPFRSFLSSPLPYKAALFGTGPLASIQFRQLGSSAVELRFSPFKRETDSLGKAVPLYLRSSDNPSRAVLVDRIPLIQQFGDGLHVAVIDPENGLIVKHATFTSGELLEWQLQEVQFPDR